MSFLLHGSDMWHMLNPCSYLASVTHGTCLILTLLGKCDMWHVLNLCNCLVGMHVPHVYNCLDGAAA